MWSVVILTLGMLCSVKSTTNCILHFCYPCFFFSLWFGPIPFQVCAVLCVLTVSELACIAACAMQLAFPESCSHVSATTWCNTTTTNAEDHSSFFFFSITCFWTCTYLCFHNKKLVGALIFFSYHWDFFFLSITIQTIFMISIQKIYLQYLELKLSF